jgi:hypothetical protein
VRRFARIHVRSFAVQDFSRTMLTINHHSSNINHQLSSSASDVKSISESNVTAKRLQDDTQVGVALNIHSVHTRTSVWCSLPSSREEQYRSLLRSGSDDCNESVYFDRDERSDFRDRRSDFRDRVIIVVMRSAIYTRVLSIPTVLCSASSCCYVHADFVPQGSSSRFMKLSLIRD